MANAHYPSSSTTASTAAGAPPDIRYVKGVGPAMAKKLENLGISSTLGLLFHLPLRYEDRTQVYPIGSLRNGQRVAVEGEIVSNKILFGKRRSLACQIEDGSGILNLRFFHFSAAQQKSLAIGDQLRCFGEVSLTRSGLTMIHPEYEKRKASDSPQTQTPNHLTAVYPSTEGLHQARWRVFIQSAFQLVDPTHIAELISPEQLKRVGLDVAENLYQVLKTLHFPPTNINQRALLQGTHPLQRRLAFEELVAQRISHLEIKSRQQQQPAIAIAAHSKKEDLFRQQLPFTLTRAQNRVLEEIFADMARPCAMLRLIQGDVGSGKTVVAAIAAIHAESNGLQTAMMAPTEILAEQHAASMQSWLQPLDISVCLLLSKMTAAEKRDALTKIESNQAQVIIGTHALIQETVNFSNLGLVIIDEQHRFGVEQRRSLINKRNDGLGVHQLIMTATPIPRTLAMTFYADLDYSVIDELPPGRTPVQTVAISNERRDQVIERVRRACLEGRQVYWVCTLVEESEILECQAAESTASELADSLRDISVGLVHGRIKGEQKQRVMQAFNAGEIQLLVATTVIEVGVDVPNASLMIIENPERLGLAQLHQLRGRVGRGQIESHCVLLYQKPLSQKGKQRLDIMRSTNDGFQLAEQDLKMRGPGEVLGTRQSGAVTMQIADLERDADMVEGVVKLSDEIFSNEPGRASLLVRRWCPLVDRYSKV